MTKNGKPCRVAAMEGGLCFFHANPNKAVELGRIGGKKNGLVRVGLDPLPNLDSAIAIRDTVTRLISDVYEGKLHPRIAAGLAPLMHLQLRAVVASSVAAIFVTCLTILGKHPNSRPGVRIRWRHFGTKNHRAVCEIKCIPLQVPCGVWKQTGRLTYTAILIPSTAANRLGGSGDNQLSRCRGRLLDGAWNIAFCFILPILAVARNHSPSIRIIRAVHHRRMQLARTDDLAS
jgi:hypothetical protein